MSHTVYDDVYHTPLGRFSMLGISTVEIVPVPKSSALETPRRELSKDVSFRIGTLLVVEQLGLAWKTVAGVCDIHNQSYPVARSA